MNVCVDVGKNILCWHGPQPELVITEPEVVKEIMSIKEISMGKPGVGPIYRKMLGGGLVLSQGDKWAKQRKIATHAFKFNESFYTELLPSQLIS
ncbi:hypothetical protein R6Q57_021935 [Mikania cordata]